MYFPPNCSQSQSQQQTLPYTYVQDVSASSLSAEPHGGIETGWAASPTLNQYLAPDVSTYQSSIPSTSSSTTMSASNSMYAMSTLSDQHFYPQQHDGATSSSSFVAEEGEPCGNDDEFDIVRIEGGFRCARCQWETPCDQKATLHAQSHMYGTPFECLADHCRLTFEFAADFLHHQLDHEGVDHFQPHQSHHLHSTKRQYEEDQVFQYSPVETYAYVQSPTPSDLSSSKRRRQSDLSLPPTPDLTPEQGYHVSEASPPSTRPHTSASMQISRSLTYDEHTARLPAFTRSMSLQGLSHSHPSLSLPSTPRTLMARASQEYLPVSPLATSPSSPMPGRRSRANSMLASPAHIGRPPQTHSIKFEHYVNPHTQNKRTSIASSPTYSHGSGSPYSSPILLSPSLTPGSPSSSFSPTQNSGNRSSLIQLSSVNRLFASHPSSPVTSVHPKFSQPPPKEKGGKAHVCSFRGCGKPFKRSEHLKRHEKTHTDERPFKCDICNRDFSRSDNRDAHIKSVHEKANKATD